MPYYVFKRFIFLLFIVGITPVFHGCLRSPINNTVNTGTQADASIPKANYKKIIIYAKDGSPLLVNDFYSEYAKNCKNGQCAMIPEGGSRFILLYFEGDSSFYLEIGSVFGGLKQMRENRTNGEQFLLATLGISKSEACKLKIRVGAIKENSMIQSVVGKNYGLSFCPGAKRL